MCNDGLKDKNLDFSRGNHLSCWKFIFICHWREQVLTNKKIFKSEKALNQEEHFLVLKSLENNYKINWKQFLSSIKNIGRFYKVVLPEKELIDIFPEDLSYDKVVFLIVAFENYFYGQAILEENALYMTKIDQILMVLYKIVHLKYENSVFLYLTTRLEKKLKIKLRTIEIEDASSSGILISKNTKIFDDLRLSNTEFLFLIETLEIKYSVDIPRVILPFVKEIKDVMRTISCLMLISEYRKWKEKEQKESIYTHVRFLTARTLSFDKDQILKSSNFSTDLGANSLDMVKVIKTFEAFYNLDISKEEASSISKVEEAVEIIYTLTYKKSIMEMVPFSIIHLLATDDKSTFDYTIDNESKPMKLNYLKKDVVSVCKNIIMGKFRDILLIVLEVFSGIDHNNHEMFVIDKDFKESIKFVGKEYGIDVPDEKLCPIFLRDLNYARVLYIVKHYEDFFYGQKIIDDDAFDDPFLVSKLDQAITLLSHLIYSNLEQSTLSFLNKIIATELEINENKIFYKEDYDLFLDLELSPLNFSRIVKALESEYGICIPAEKTKSVATIKDLSLIVSQRVFLKNSQKLEEKELLMDFLFLDQASFHKELINTGNSYESDLLLKFHTFVKILFQYFNIKKAISVSPLTLFSELGITSRELKNFILDLEDIYCSPIPFLESNKAQGNGTLGALFFMISTKDLGRYNNP